MRLVIATFITEQVPGPEIILEGLQKLRATILSCVPIGGAGNSSSQITFLIADDRIEEMYDVFDRQAKNSDCHGATVEIPGAVNLRYYRTRKA